MKRTLAAISIVALAAVGVLAFQSAKPPADQVARFTPEGRLIRPKGWETWVMVGASTGLSYAKPATPAVAGASPGMFHNVYLQPWAYRYVMEHGAFPEGAMLVLSFFESSRKSNPARAGFYEGERIPGMEVHLKKADVDSTGWGFYGFGDTASSGAKQPGSLACYSCHKTEAAFDNAFV
ncbi:MAG TPA: cytochrome P460 family protein, partial [Gemmatimonadales bacterium]|nr:cytochrome P460 family protein [Gemmatimonadales bacterium]